MTVKKILVKWEWAKFRAMFWTAICVTLNGIQTVIDIPFTASARRAEIALDEMAKWNRELYFY